MKTKILLGISLGIMAAIIIYGAIYPESLERMLKQPEFYSHARFIHIIASALFFSTAVLGMLWEARSLVSGDPDIIRHTYDTVTWLDARFSTPMIVLTLISGLMLSEIMGGLLSAGWLTFSFGLFILSGIVWVVTDIPTQYKVKRLFNDVKPGDKEMPDELMKLLWRRMKIGIAGTLPLLIVYIIMVYKQDIPNVADWFGSSDKTVEDSSGIIEK